MSAELPFKNAPRVGGMDVGERRGGKEGRKHVFRAVVLLSVAFLSQSPPQAESPIPTVPQALALS